jgi:hypothetical protein
MNFAELPSRPIVGYAALAFLFLLLLVDHRQAQPINPYQAPPPIALGSGLAPTAAHCTAL